MTQLSSRALWLEPPGRASLRSETLPERQPGDLLVRTRYSTVSRGTETLVYTGAVPDLR